MSIAKFDPSRLPDPDELGFFMHPDVPGKEESDDVQELLEAMGFESNLVCFKYDGDDSIVSAWFFACDGCDADEMREAMRQWRPTQPDGGNWVLAGKFDTEDGPYALFVRPIQPPKGKG